jgi:hypothetical protein
MNTVLVWVLVVATYGNGARLDVSGDYATVDDCERVRRAVLSAAGAVSSGAKTAQCVQVKKVK